MNMFGHGGEHAPLARLKVRQPTYKDGGDARTDEEVIR